MKKPTLVIMAAGIGSRFGGGIKQLEPVGPNGEIIMDYSIRHAVEAGFRKVVFIIRKDLEETFKEVIGNRMEKEVEVAYAFQELDDIPEQFQGRVKDRTKPWGTGQAILACKEIVKEPFVVINADDYYGRQAYKESYQYLTETQNEQGKLSVCMVGFVLENTLSENGGVTRGICKVNAEGMLTDIVETHNIVKCSEGAKVVTDESEVFVDARSVVSMNMWGFMPNIFEVLDRKFAEFFEELDTDDKKSEFLLPTIIGDLLQRGEAKVRVLRSQDKWFGITYKEDKEAVKEALKTL